MTTSENKVGISATNGNVTITNGGSLESSSTSSGIYVDGTGDVVIEENSSLTADSGYYGIYLVSTSTGDVTITDSSVTADGTYGIFVKGTGDVTITDSSMDSSGYLAIYSTAGGDVMMDNSTLTYDAGAYTGENGSRVALGGIYTTSSVTITNDSSVAGTDNIVRVAVTTADFSIDGTSALDGLVQTGSAYTAYGNAALNFDLELSDTTTLTITTGSTLTVSDGVTLSTTEDGSLILQEGATLALAAGATFSHEGDLYIDFGGVYDDTEGDHQGSADSAVYYQVKDETGGIISGTTAHDGKTYALAGTTVAVAEKEGQTAHITYVVADGTKVTVDSTSLTVTEPVTVTAVSYTDNDYTVTMNTDGGTINSGNMTGYTYGLGAALPTDMTKTGYTFAGWYESADFSGQAVTAVSATDTGDKTYYAKWTLNSYTVTWLNTDGTVLATDTVNHGDTPAYTGATPTKAADDTYTYTFAGWDKELSAATGDVTYTAVFTATAIPVNTGAAEPSDTATPSPTPTDTAAATSEAAASPADTAPATGDESQGTLWFAALLLTAVGLAVIAVCGRKRRID